MKQPRINQKLAARIRKGVPTAKYFKLATLVDIAQNTPPRAPTMAQRRMAEYWMMQTNAGMPLLESQIADIMIVAVFDTRRVLQKSKRGFFDGND